MYSLGQEASIEMTERRFDVVPFIRRRKAMDNGNSGFLLFVFFWQLILTVAFVIHWIKVERNTNFHNHMGTKVSENLKNKVLGH